MTKYPIDLRIVLVIWLISWCLLAYSIYYQIRKATITERKSAIILTIYSSISVFLLFFLYFEHFEIMIITESSYGIGLLWSLMVGLIAYMFMNICGIGKAKSNNKYEIVIVFILIILSLSGYGYFGVRIDIHERSYIYDYLYYYSFQTNSERGIKFIAYNWFFMVLIYFISFMTEREIS